MVIAKGDLICAKRFTTLNRVSGGLIDLRAIENGTYIHEIWSDENIIVAPDIPVIVMAYLSQPTSIVYKVHKRTIPLESLLRAPKELCGHVAYVFYKDSDWVTTVYETETDFLDEWAKVS